MNDLSLQQIIDLDRFPIDDPTHPEYHNLMQRGRQSLEDCALFSMEQFIRPEVVPLMAEELLGLLPRSC